MLFDSGLYLFLMLYAASKKSVEDLIHSPIADFADSNVECCVCQELFKNYIITKPEIGDNDEAMIP